jgi:hypothetical protein
MPIDTPSAESKKELVERLKALLLQAQSGELKGFMCLTIDQTTGQRELHIAGDYCDESPMVIESTKAVLVDLMDGKDPTGGALKN